MAVSIDTVYQRVLTLASKEQRGYITPQEFNLLANHAQMEIFEQYFYDIKQFNRIPGNTTEYSDSLDVLDEKIGIFEEQENNAWMYTNMTVHTPPNEMYIRIPNTIYKIGTIGIKSNTNSDGNFHQVELLNSKDFDTAMLSSITTPTLNRPIGTLTSRGLKVYISKNDFITPETNILDPLDPEMNISYIARPRDVQWAYVVINDKALNNPNISIDFELHQSDESELVYKILKLAGITLNKAEIVQVGDTLEKGQIQQEKQ